MAFGSSNEAQREGQRKQGQLHNQPTCRKEGEGRWSLACMNSNTSATSLISSRASAGSSAEQKEDRNASIGRQLGPCGQGGRWGENGHRGSTS